MLQIKTCPTCGSKRIARVKRTLIRTYRGRRYAVPDLEFHECPNCGERLFDRAASKKLEAYSPAFAQGPRRKSA